MVTKLLHTRYRVSDLEKTLYFYKEVLGLQELEDAVERRGIHHDRAEERLLRLEIVRGDAPFESGGDLHGLDPT